MNAQFLDSNRPMYVHHMYDLSCGECQKLIPSFGVRYSTRQRLLTVALKYDAWWLIIDFYQCTNYYDLFEFRSRFQFKIIFFLVKLINYIFWVTFSSLRHHRKSSQHSVNAISSTALHQSIACNVAILRIFGFAAHKSTFLILCRSLPFIYRLRPMRVSYTGISD